MEDFRLNKEEGFDPRKYNVLVVEDSLTARVLINGILKEIGYLVELAVDGQDAINRISDESKDKIHVVLLDIILPPGPDGFDICRFIKENEKTKNTPVIFVTAHQDRETIKKMRGQGVYDVIFKPVDFSNIYMRVENAICKFRREKERVKQQKTQELIFQTAQDPPFITLPNGEIIEIGPSIEKSSGFTREELIGKRVTDYYFDAESRREFLRILNENGEVKDYKMKLKRKDGKSVDAIIQAVKTKDEDMETEMIVGSIHEVAEKIIPFCAYCRKYVRNNSNSNNWIRLEEYLINNAQKPSHSICPDCLKKEFPDFDIQKNK